MTLQRKYSEHLIDLSYSKNGCRCRLNKGGILFGRTRYQEGSLALEARKRGPAVWVYRWWQKDINGKPVRRKVQLGNLEQYPNESRAQAAADALRLTINEKTPRQHLKEISVATLVQHYREHEMPDIFSKKRPSIGTICEHEEGRKSYSTQETYEGYPEKVDRAEMGVLPARGCQSSPGGTMVEDVASGTWQQGEDQKHHERFVQPRDTVGMDGQESDHASSSERQTLVHSSRFVSGRNSTALLLHQGAMPDCGHSRCGERFTRGRTAGTEVARCQFRATRIERHPLRFSAGCHSLQDGSFAQIDSHESGDCGNAFQMEDGSSIQRAGRLDFRQPAQSGNPTVLAWVAVQGAYKTRAAEGGYFCKSRLAHVTAQFWNLDESQWRRPQDHPRAAAPRNLQSHSRHLHTSGYAGEAGRSSKTGQADHGGRFRTKGDHADSPIAYWTQTDPDWKGSILVSSLDCWRPRRDLNPCYRRERATLMAIEIKEGGSDGIRNRGLLRDRSATSWGYGP